MPLPVAAFAPWGNAQLTFSVSGDAVTVDEETGNPMPATQEIEYLAALRIQPINRKEQPGADEGTFQCSGRLLFPTALDPRLSSGSQAAAVINGYRGRFELRFDLAMDEAYRALIGQTIAGTFRVVGGADYPPPTPDPGAP